MAGWRWLLLYFWMVPERGWQRDTVLSSMPFAQRCSGLGGIQSRDLQLTCRGWRWLLLEEGLTARRSLVQYAFCVGMFKGGWAGIVLSIDLRYWEGLTARRSLVQYAFCVEMFGHTLWDLAIDWYWGRRKAIRGSGGPAFWALVKQTRRWHGLFS